MKRLAAAAIGLLLAAGCRAPRSFPGAPIILISIDTLRADHLPAYGYAKVETPAIDALRRDAVLFTNAVSHVPLTLPSHTTLLTGLLPPQNGVRDNSGYALPDKPATLAQVLKDHGYATGAAVSAVVLSRASGIARGFDFYDDQMEALLPGEALSDVQRSGFETERLAEEWIRQHEEGPFFFFLHLYEPHTPYDPPEPFRSRYRDAPYDGEIAAADAIVGKFLEFLKGDRLYGRAAVILLSDHGEGLGQHGEDEHGVLLYRETLHVPLVLKLPGGRRAGEKVGRPVGLVDVFPTVAALLGIAAPPGLPGSPLLGPGPEGRRIYSETLYPRYHFGFSDLAALTDARFEYIHAPREELYDWVADPMEGKNLAPELPPAFRTMRNALAAMDRPRQAPGASDPEQVKKLAALGYLGAASPPESAENLPDPKDHMAELRDLKAAAALSAQGRAPEASKILEKLVARNPLLADAWGSLADAYRRQGRLPEALAALGRQDRLTPGSPQVLETFAGIHLEMGDLAKAGTDAQRAVAAGGGPEAHETLARVLLQRRDWDGAEKEARLALAAQDRRRLPRVILALAARGRGDNAGALAILDAVREGSRAAGEPPMSNLDFQRAQVLAALGRIPEAEAALAEETRNFPGNLGAWAARVELAARQGRREEARSLIEQMASTSGNPIAPRLAAELAKELGGRR